MSLVVWGQGVKRLGLEFMLFIFYVVAVSRYSSTMQLVVVFL